MRLAKLAVPLSLACSILFSTPLQARADSPHVDIYHQSGLQQQLVFFWQQIRDEYKGLPKKSNDTQIEQSIHSLIESEFSELQLRDTILKYWGRQMDSEDLAIIAKWLASPVGKKLTLAETNAALAAGDTTFADYSKSLRQQPPTKKRIELLRVLEKAVHGSASSADMGIHIHLAAVSALHASGYAPDNSMSPAEQAQSHESDRALIRAMMRQDILRYNLFVYRDLQDEELQAYITFAQSPAGARYHETTFFATREALISATKELQKQIQGQSLETNSTARLPSN